MDFRLSKSYPFKVWLATLLIAAVLFCIFSGFDRDSLWFIIYAFVYGLVLSIPAFLIYYLIYFKAKFKSPLFYKIVPCLVAIIGMAITIFIFFGKDSYNPKQNFSGIAFSILYAVSISISSFIFSVHKK